MNLSIESQRVEQQVEANSEERDCSALLTHEFEILVIGSAISLVNGAPNGGVRDSQGGFDFR